MKKRISLLGVFFLTFLSGCLASTPKTITPDSHEAKETVLFSDFLYYGKNLSGEVEKEYFQEISSKPQKNGFLYTYQFSGGGYGPNAIPAPAVKITFLTEKKAEKIEVNHTGAFLEIPEIDISSGPHYIVMKHHFGLECQALASAHPNLLLPSGHGEIFGSGRNYGTQQRYPYLNHRSKPTYFFDHHGSWGIYPSWKYDKWPEKSRKDFGRNDCRIEVGDPRHFNELKFSFGTGFENVTIGMIKEKNQNSDCKSLLEHDIKMEFYNDQALCSLWIDTPQSIKEISMGG